MTLQERHSLRQRDWRAEHGHFQWFAFLNISACHVGALLAFRFFTWPAVWVAVALWVVTAGLGVCVGYHRLLTHRSFETHAWMKRLLTLIGTLAVQGGPSVWVGTHRLHHQHSDRPGDPHSPRDDFWWGHAIWLCFFEHLDARVHAGDLARDPWLRRLDQFWFLPAIVLAVILWWLGGWPWVVWGTFVRTVFVWHVTWAVNSVSHRWGYRNYDTPDGSQNNVLVALLSFGEGWHNNHHAFPASARHGLRRWELDPAYLFIRALEGCGLAWNVRKPAPAST